MLSTLINLEGKARVKVLPGPHHFQAPKVMPDCMRPAVLHSYGASKTTAQQSLQALSNEGREPVLSTLVGLNLPFSRVSLCPNSWHALHGQCPAPATQHDDNSTHAVALAQSRKASATTAGTVQLPGIRWTTRAHISGLRANTAHSLERIHDRLPRDTSRASTTLTGYPHPNRKG